MSPLTASLLEEPRVVQQSAEEAEFVADGASLVARSSVAPPPRSAPLDLFVRRQGVPPLAPAGNRTSLYLALKRSIDVAGALALLLLLSPVMFATWLILLWTTKGRPIFVQERVGFLGKPFRMYKFRTMIVGAAAQQQAIANHKDGPIFKNFSDPRITRTGRILRSLSIDEMPQLVNVLLGQMSLVGPRPALADEVREYQPWQRTRLTVKPGLTCLWQVSGRSEIGFDEWMRMDAWYVDHQTFWTDLKLLARTPWSVISRRGAY